MQIRETAWNQLLSDWQICIDTETCSLPVEVQRLLKNGQAMEIEAQNPAGFIMVNVIGEESEIDVLHDYFPAGDRQSGWKWNFDGTTDVNTEYEGQEDDILATQPAGSTFENPYWVHGWMGQGDEKYIQRFSSFVPEVLAIDKEVKDKIKKRKKIK